MIYSQLFIIFFKIGALSFGGGYAALPLIEKLVVHQEKWLTLSDFTDLITISQMTPGPIAINAATFIGLQVGGIQGAIIATFACILPSIFIVSLLALLYARYQKLDLMQDILSILRPAVVALIASSGLSILITALWSNRSLHLNHINGILLVIFILAFVGIRKLNWNPILVMLASGFINLILNLI